MKGRKRAAHFLLLPELAHSPPNDALVTALLDLGYAVDLFAPGGDFNVSRYGPAVTAQPVEYGYRWFARRLWSPRWRRYAMFSGTTEDPMAVAGALARVHRRPCLTLADEIRSGSYCGPRSERWKSLCRWGMRASALTIVNEAERIALQRDYARLSPKQEIVIYPGCFRQPPTAWDVQQTRAQRGIPEDAVLVCYSGVINLGNGGLWLAEALDAYPDVWWWGQIVHSDPLVRGLLRGLRGAERLVLEPARLSWQDAWASMGAVDIGMVVYLQDGPQFRHMGIASNRLCMFLAMGVPVIATRQPSFEFIEGYDCGVLVDSHEEFISAIETVGAHLPQMKRNARICAREYIDAPDKFERLREAVRELAA